MHIKIWMWLASPPLQVTPGTCCRLAPEIWQQWCIFMSVTGVRKGSGTNFQHEPPIGRFDSDNPGKNRECLQRDTELTPVPGSCLMLVPFTVGEFVSFLSPHMATLLLPNALALKGFQSRERVTLSGSNTGKDRIPSRELLAGLPGRVFTVWHQSDSCGRALWCHTLALLFRVTLYVFWKVKILPREFNRAWRLSCRGERLGCNSTREFPAPTCACPCLSCQRD